jgi:hypothetical protein
MGWRRVGPRVELPDGRRLEVREADEGARLAAGLGGVPEEPLALKDEDLAGREAFQPGLELLGVATAGLVAQVLEGRRVLDGALQEKSSLEADPLLLGREGGLGSEDLEAVPDRVVVVGERPGDGLPQKDDEARERARLRDAPRRRGVEEVIRRGLSGEGALGRAVRGAKLGGVPLNAPAEAQVEEVDLFGDRRRDGRVAGQVVEKGGRASLHRAENQEGRRVHEAAPRTGGLGAAHGAAPAVEKSRRRRPRGTRRHGQRPRCLAWIRAVSSSVRLPVCNQSERPPGLTR